MEGLIFRKSSPTAKRVQIRHNLDEANDSLHIRRDEAVG
jgi:hypothetical protein